MQSVLASEKQVSQLMAQLDIAINEVDRVEAQLNSYDDILCHIRNTMEKMEEKNMLIEIANINNQKLLTELEKVVVSSHLVCCRVIYLNYCFKREFSSNAILSTN